MIGIPRRTLLLMGRYASGIYPSSCLGYFLSHRPRLFMPTFTHSPSLVEICHLAPSIFIPYWAYLVTSWRRAIFIDVTSTPHGVRRDLFPPSLRRIGATLCLLFLFFARPVFGPFSRRLHCSVGEYLESTLPSVLNIFPYVTHDVITPAFTHFAYSGWDSGFGTIHFPTLLDVPTVLLILYGLMQVRVSLAGRFGALSEFNFPSKSPEDVDDQLSPDGKYIALSSLASELETCRSEVDRLFDQDPLRFDAMAALFDSDDDAAIVSDSDCDQSTGQSPTADAPNVPENRPPLRRTPMVPPPVAPDVPACPARSLLRAVYLVRPCSKHPPLPSCVEV